MNKIEFISITLLIVAFVGFSFFSIEKSSVENDETLTTSFGSTFDAGFDIGNNFETLTASLGSAVGISALRSLFTPFPFDIFGGKITSVTNCGCTPYTKFSVSKPRPGTFMVVEGGAPPLYPYSKIATGVQTLGIASGFAVCKVLIKERCIKKGGGPVVMLQGTSK